MTRHHHTFLLAIASGLFLGGGCAQMFPDKVSDGIARLTMRNLGAMVMLAVEDERCGFGNPAVIDGYVVEGEPGEIGTVTWSIRDCRIDLGDEDREIGEDCNGTTTSARGAFTISIDKVVEGQITGDPENPVVPTTDFAAAMHVREARFEGLRVSTSVSPSAMTMVAGSLSATLRPRLAAAISTGVCSVSTPIADISDVRYDEADVAVESPSMNFSAHVNSSDLRAQNGPRGTSENEIGGTVHVFGGDHEVPSDGQGLDPDYDRAVFDGSYACNLEMEYPPRFACSIEQMVGEGAARLSMLTFAGLVAAANDDENCGFESAAAKESLVTYGELGRAGGRAQTSIERCVLEFTEPTAVKSDCQEVDTMVIGRAVVSGTKTIEGILSGNVDTPAVPTSSSPAAIALRAEITELHVQDSDNPNGLTTHRGTLSGTLRPHTAIDTTSGACSKTTSIAELQAVRWIDADLTIDAEGKALDVHVANALLEGINGPVGRVGNLLSGTIDVDGVMVAIDDRPLDPDYDASTFAATYTCDEELVPPESDADCDMTPILAQGAARLLVKTFGHIVKAIDSHEVCGFKSVDGIVPGELAPAEGDQVTAVWEVSDCDVGGPEPFMYAENCIGTQTFLHGHAYVTASKAVDGLLAAGYPPLHPQSRAEVRFDIHEAVLEEFAVVEYSEGSTEPQPYMIVHQAILRGIGRPVTGEALSDPGAYYIALPVSGFEDITIVQAEVTVVDEGKHFRLTLNDSDLTAFNGAFLGKENALTGELTVDGRPFALPTSADDTALDPDYVRETFTDSYLCYENLAGPVPPN